MSIKIGSIVGRKSYKCDLLFRVTDKIDRNGQINFILTGEEMRLIADAPEDDVIEIDEPERHRRLREEKEKEDFSYRLFKQDYHLLRQQSEYNATANYSLDEQYFQLPGKVLHIDGDPLYLKKCLSLYQRIGVPVHGVYMNEHEMPEKVGQLIDQVNPDILVITGHDAYTKSKGKKTDLRAYRNSRHFINTVINARNKVKSLDELVIFAGACQSHFESLIRAGANFASSPTRVNIHALDPVYIVAKISFTSYSKHINVWDVLKNTLTGTKGLGGIETKGVLRLGLPLHEHDEDV